MGTPKRPRWNSSSRKFYPSQQRVFVYAVALCFLLSFFNVHFGTILKSSPSDNQGILPSVPGSPVVDILSTGSMSQPELLYTQRSTFGSHPSVRNFFPLTELNDTEKDCHRELTREQALRIASYCGRRTKVYPLLNDLMDLYIPEPLLRRKDNPAGWICAQKRPISGLYQLGEKFYSGNDLPDYLFIIDDDTHFDMDRVISYLQYTYPPDQAHAVAGCLLRMKEVDFSLYFGGFGSFLTRRALQDLMRPLDCSLDSDPWMAQVCESLKYNRIGEAALFKTGMSVLELMFAYTMDQPFLNFNTWNDAGFCLHSDTTFSYFLNYFTLPVPAETRSSQDRLVAYKNSTWYRGRKDSEYMQHRRQCLNKGDEMCNLTSDICHEVSAGRMGQLFQERKGISTTG